jgi:hypothetical protein
MSETCTINCQGRAIEATVISAANWGSEAEPNWYVEFDGPNGYGYWKQGLDGGTVVFHDLESDD